MKGGYAGLVLDVDLTTDRIRKTPTDQFFNTKLFIGGKGLGAVTLWKKLKPKVDPLSPENILMFLTGPLTGTLCPGTRMCVVTKSPLTNTFCDSYVGGHLGAEFKFAGYDALVVRGRSEKPVYLWIKDDTIDLCDAEKLWGLDTFETEEKIRRIQRDPTVRVCCIGPAGERLVRFAHVNTERYRQAGRGGTGAVMGSKNLKAVAVKGTGEIKAHTHDDFDQFAREAYHILLKNPTIRARRRWGTARSVLFASDQDLYPTRNYQEATFEGAEALSAEAMEKQFWVKHKACYGCPVNCGKLGVIRNGPYKGTVLDGIEYETTAMLGANCGISDLEAVAHANMLCDKLGLDTISAGNVIAYAMECYEKGILTEKETDGLQLKFGNQKAMIELLRRIAHRKGLGNILAEGVKKLSERLGEKAEGFAMHVKGLELPGWGVRAAPRMGLAYATADRGGCHTRAWSASSETATAAQNIREQQDYGSAADCLVACWFVRDAIGAERYAKMITAATGMRVTEDEFVTVGERIWNLVRMFNAREGFTKRDDTLPKRMLAEPLPSGVAKGQKLPQRKLSRMLDEYYELRGWDRNTGMPTREKLRELKLDFVKG
ncbi:MAG: aldehyde ferredoxin oxidoreductase family protein [Candidatus Bathyarchaeia archaeon]